MDQNIKHSKPYIDPDFPTLAGVLAAFEILPNETPSRKARVKAAVSMIARLTGQPADSLQALPKVLKHQFAQLKKMPTGLSSKTIANCKSELRHLMNTVGDHDRKSGLMPLSEVWLNLRESFGDRPELWKLSRFFAYCSALAVTPQWVNDATVGKFRSALIEGADVEKPEQIVRNAIRAWNTLAEIGGSDTVPLAILTLPPQRTNRWTIEPSLFPPSFQDEVTRWLDRLSKVDPEAEEGPIRALRPASLAGHKHTVFKAASALVFSGRAIESSTSIAWIVEMDAFKALMRHLRERQGGQPTLALYSLATTLKSLARHEVGIDNDHLKRMARICANYNVDDTVSKSRDRLESFEDERLLGALLHLPERLLRQAAQPKTSAKCAKTFAQMAAAIEIEFHSPIRLSNLAALNLQQNIQSVIIKGETRWIIRFDRNETKNHGRLTYELPAGAVKRIKRALAFYEQTDGWLFPGGKGSHKTPGFLGDQLKQTVERYLSTPFNIHLMRGLVATMQIRENDNGFEMARAMLGDRSDKVIRKHYTATADQHLIRKAQDTVQRVRVRTAAIVTPRPKLSAST
jgi:integrase